MLTALQPVNDHVPARQVPAGNHAQSGFIRLLDRSVIGFQRGAPVAEIWASLNNAAGVLRHQLLPADWQALCAATLAHPVMQFIRQDPMIDRCIRRPRGYAGDAVMIDMLYHHPDISPQLIAATPLGRQLHTFGVHAPVAQAVRDRRQVLADLLDGAAANVAGPHVLAVAAGHLREAELSSAFASGGIGRMVALDQDAESCGVIGYRHGDKVEIVPQSITGLLRHTLADDRFHLIYAAGLYDYLDERLGALLTKRLADRLAPGGRLVVANLADVLWDAGGMEAMMDWHLIYRNAADMAALAAHLGPEFAVNQFSGSHGDMLYLDVTRHG
ncbi:MAG: class I SAM-dependent methyltransferase [Sphingomonadales bacterium]|jgi:SAM-dependent methyltransferase